MVAVEEVAALVEADETHEVNERLRAHDSDTHTQTKE
jgi:hypothetical protein